MHDPGCAATAAEQIRLWLSVLLGPLVTAIGFGFIYKQIQIAALQAGTSARVAERAATEAAQQQVWKKAEFLANQVKDFFGDETVKKVTYMLDWHVRSIQLEPGKEKILSCHDGEFDATRKHELVILTSALRQNDSTPFTKLEMLVRDDFDWFFFRLGQFQHMIQAGLFSYAEVEVHLSYVLDLISGGIDHVSPKLVEAIDRYVQLYDFPAVAVLTAARTSTRGKAKERVAQAGE
ncbi:hypothetical protein TSA1_28065 [Bradyrhizobium nitroreducens]|uniref:Uncharacterized protein n=1 Tax=Bradyrhizobium nitroreducens TaxID=709803 RepID=A0A2M6UI46_9BRAD|nr:hypothetical protein [Bradyrhizobium nitroreducens]PIT04187.1 hypothetical protein TSA1_28065 [Bradyrhizobium nitroreducens]